MTRLAIRVGERTFRVELAGPPVAGKLDLWLNDQATQVIIPQTGVPLATLGWLVIDDRPYEIELDPELRWIATEPGPHHLEVKDVEDIAVRAIKGNGRVKAPIPGQITRLFVASGQVVEAEQPLCVLEAMKMENEVRATQAGVVTGLPVTVGQVVSRGQLLAEIS
jgi:biotin carboxyl carrier protein